MLQTINNKIRRGFNGAAERYDQFTGLHREIADKLFAQVINEPKSASILDVGCGTGYLTGRLKDHFPQSKIVGLDYAQGMLKIARQKHDNISWVLGDGINLPFFDGCFDILVSNLAYQWAGDLSVAFSEARRVLSPQGVLAGTLFGLNTCQELFQSLNEAKTGEFQFTRLPNETQVREALIIGGFTDPEVNGEQVRIQFRDMHDLIAWLKSIGANNLPREGYLGKDGMARASAIYRERYPLRNGVGATFEVIKFNVKK